MQVLLWNAYQRNPKGSVEIKLWDKKYTIDFKRWCQTKQSTSYERSLSVKLKN